MSYELLSSLNEGMEVLLTGTDTNPTTLANAIEALRTSLDTPATTNTTIAALDRVMVTSFVSCAAC